jgi:hypothetical protein
VNGDGRMNHGNGRGAVEDESEVLPTGRTVSLRDYGSGAQDLAAVSDMVSPDAREGEGIDRMRAADDPALASSILACRLATP